MLLRVPAEDVSHVGTREWIRRVAVDVGQCIVAEVLREVGTVVQSEGVVDRVPGLVTQVAHRFLVALNRARVLGLDALEPLIGQIERHADQRGAIRASPFIAQIYRWPERDMACRELVVQPIHQALHTGSRDLEPELGDPSTEQLPTLGVPLGRSAVHGRHGGKARTEPIERTKAPRKSVALSSNSYPSKDQAA